MIGASPPFRALKANLRQGHPLERQGHAQRALRGGQGDRRALTYTPIRSGPAGPFITVNSASIEPERMEEVLFGRPILRTRARIRAFWNRRTAASYFFDEVGDMPSAPSRRSCAC